MLHLLVLVVKTSEQRTSLYSVLGRGISPNPTLAAFMKGAERTASGKPAEKRDGLYSKGDVCFTLTRKHEEAKLMGEGVVLVEGAVKQCDTGNVPLGSGQRMPAVQFQVLYYRKVIHFP